MVKASAFLHAWLPAGCVSRVTPQREERESVCGGGHVGHGLMPGTQ